MLHLDKASIHRFKSEALAEFDAASLTDISEVTVERDRPLHERAENFIAQVRNPYLFRVGDTPVRISFTDNGPSLESQLVSVAKRANW